MAVIEFVNIYHYKFILTGAWQHHTDIKVNKGNTANAGICSNLFTPQ